VAAVTDSVQDLRNYGVADGRPAVVLMLYKQPDANIIDAVDRVRALIPFLQASIAAAIDLKVVSDRSPTIRASLREMQRTLLISVALVFGVVFLFLRSLRATIIPSIAVPVSLAGTFVVMHLAGLSLNNISLMALIVATGFVVDDAIVVLENIARHIERGRSVLEASLEGVREVAFTVISISISLVAVFIPILLMGGIIGRLFREFAIVMTAAIGVSMLVSLSTTPMMCAVLLRPRPPRRPRPRLIRWLRLPATLAMRGYHRSLAWALRYQPLVLAALVGVIAFNVHLYSTIAKGFFPQQDTGRIIGFIRADQATSFQAMQSRLDRFLEIVRADPAVEAVTGFTGGSTRNSAQMFIALKPLAERQVAADRVVARLRGRLAREPGASLFMVPVQDIRVGGRQASSQYQFTLQADEFEVLREWEPRVRRALSRLPELVDIDSDVQDRGRQTSLVIDRDAVARLGLSVRTIDATLNNAFGQRQIGVIYNPLNQYRVVLELAPEFTQSPETLRSLIFISGTGERIPLTDFARIEETAAPLSVSHQSGTPASTISFNLAPGVSLSQASAAIQDAVLSSGAPASVRGTFQGTARAFAQSLDQQPLLILAAIVAIYLVLGVLYESLVHPITILSTLPSAGVGALLALKWFNTEFSIIAMIGVILLIGIVKKNAIIMIDFAISRQRRTGIGPGAAIYAAARLRLRPIMMTTAAALCGAIPLAVGVGDGAELRQPLGMSILGGLVLSQLLTLYTTPVVYVAIDRLRSGAQWLARKAWSGPARGATALVVLMTMTLLAGCAGGPRAPVTPPLPPLAASADFRHAGLFKPAIERVSVAQDWWTLYQDDALNALQRRLPAGNPNLAASLAQVRIAQAALEASRAPLLPLVGAGFSATRAEAATAAASGSAFTPSFSVSWEVDLWGRLGQQVDAAQARLDASEFDRQALQLSLQALLTQTWLSLRAAQTQLALLDDTIQAYQRSLNMTQDRYRVGIVPATDVAQAQTQLKSAQAQAAEVAGSRTLLENALAVLVGEVPAALQVEAARGLPDPPEVPLQLPAELLRRRPDVAAAERRTVAAAAQAGVASAAFFPTVTLGANGSLRAGTLADLLAVPPLFWSLGPSLALAAFDGGARKAALASAQASLEQAAAQYRQVVLSAIQEVEDNLALSTALNRQSQLLEESLVEARRALELTLNQYRAGTVSYLNVVAAQTTALSVERSLLDSRSRRLAASNQLLKNLAGGWGRPQTTAPSARDSTGR
jgi:multidrug efflux pump